MSEAIVRIAARGDGVTASGRHVAFAAPGDLVVVCADDAVGVYREAMTLAGRSQGQGATAFADPGELEAPEG